MGESECLLSWLPLSCPLEFSDLDLSCSRAWRSRHCLVVWGVRRPFDSSVTMVCVWSGYLPAFVLSGDR